MHRPIRRCGPIEKSQVTTEMPLVASKGESRLRASSTTRHRLRRNWLPGRHQSKTAVAAIGALTQPANSVIAKSLESSGNLTGQGIIVFVRAQSNCAPHHTWIWLGERTPSYALDEASLALTLACKP